MPLPFLGSLMLPRFKKIASGALLAILAHGLVPSALAQDNLHGLLAFDFSDHYITPRGLNTENQGVVIQPLLLLFWDLYSSKTGPLDDISLTTGVWNDWDSHQSGATPGNWNEIDPILGLTFKAEKSWQFDVFYTEFHSQTDSYPPSTNLDLKLTYHDAGVAGFSFNPYLEYFQDLHEKATVVFNPATSHLSDYWAIGCDPTYHLTSGGAQLELPTFANFVGRDFYQRLDGGPGGSGFAVFSTELKASTPLNFMPTSYGHWSAYIAEQYYYLDNHGLIDGNTVLASATRKSDLFQFHTGFTIFF